MSSQPFIASARRSPRMGRNHLLFLGSLTGLTLGAAEGAFPKSPDDIELPALSVQDQTSDTPQDSYRAEGTGLGKLTESLTDTPQSVNVITQKLMEDQGVITMRDALRAVPGISINAGESGAQGDNLTIRGFSAQGNFYIDGMRDSGSYYRDPFDSSQIDVLKGPASILFGRGSTGGVIEQDSKAAGLTPLTVASATVGTDATKRVTLDWDRPLSDSPAEGTALRINAMVNSGGVTGRDAAENSRFGIAPTLTFGLGTPTRITISYFHQSEFDIPDYGLPWLYQGTAGQGVGRASPVDLSLAGSNFYGFAHSDFLRTNVDIPTVKIEHDISDAVSIRDQARYANYTRRYRITEPQISSLISPTANLDTLSVTRNRLSGYSTETFLQNQTDATWRFRTGPIEHTAVTGIEIGRETSAPVRFSTSSAASTTPLADPSYDQADNIASYTSAHNVATAYSHAFYLLDTLKYGTHWELMAGMRFDHFDSKLDAISYNSSGAVTSRFQGHHVDEVPSWRTALIYKPAQNGSVYFAAGTSFDPSAETLTASAANAILAPVENISKEVGTKWDLASGRLALAAALYEIEQLNVRETDPNNSALQILAGDAQVRGWEISATGHLTPQWEINAGYSYNFSSIISSPSTSVTSDLGHRLGNTPLHSGSVWTAYTLPSKLEVGGGVTYVGNRYASTTGRTIGGVTFWSMAPEYATVALMAKYPVNDTVTAQVNLTNLFDTRYYDQIHPGHIVPGEGRTGMLTLTAKF